MGIVQRTNSMGLRRLVVATAVGLSGCASDRLQVTPVPTNLGEKNPQKLICIVENPRVVAPSFLEEYRFALQMRGYTVNVVKNNPQASACPLTTRYVAYANGFAQLDVYWEGQPVGRAMHSAAANSGSATRELVNRLFP